VEHHDLVDAVDEFGAELRLDLAQHGELDHLVIVARHCWIICEPRFEVIHDHRVLKSTVRPCRRSSAVVEHLQQHVEHVGVCLLDLVEQDHRVRLAPHGFGQMPAFLVAT